VWVDREELIRMRRRAALGLAFGIVALVALRWFTAWFGSHGATGPVADALSGRGLELLVICVVLVAFLVQWGTALDLATALRLRHRRTWAAGAFLGFIGWFVLVALLVRATDALRPPNSTGMGGDAPREW
jgi:hypothetical protein